MSRRVYLVGSGPGDPELLTVKAAKLLGRADVVLHDALVSSEILALIRPDAERIDVGKRCGRALLTQEEINALLVEYVKTRDVVVRLKGGDPSIFGRAGEEVTALRDAGIDFEIVPGISAASAAAAAAGISLTDRRVASQALLTSARHRGSSEILLWGNVPSETTLVIYMPGQDYARVARQLAEAGWPEDMPCAVVSNASRSNQQVRTTRIADLASLSALPSPAIIIVGRVVARDAKGAVEESLLRAQQTDAPRSAGFGL